MVLVSDLNIDPEAQRVLSMAWVKARIPKFDVDQLGYIVVNKRTNGKIRSHALPRPADLPIPGGAADIGATAHRDSSLEVSMALTLKEAAAAVADLYEALPETYLRGAYFYERDDGTPCFCAVGGVMLAANVDSLTVKEFLQPVLFGLGFERATIASDAGRETAIKMLRMAAGQP